MILTEPEEIEAWMTAPWEQARALQRPLPDGALVEVARGSKKDEDLQVTGGAGFANDPNA